MSKLQAPDLKGSIAQSYVPLAHYTTWGVGGMAETFFTPRDQDELSAVVRWTGENAEAFFVLGGGSNVLISDGVIKTPVILTKGMSEISVSVSGDEIFLDCLAGTQLKNVLSLSARNGWSGLECAAGIPGTVGGAIVGNVGTLSGYVGQAVFRIVTVEADGSVMEWNGCEIDWEYRKCPLFEDGGRIA
ncbi:MAG: FAD-binding protein, partial [Synergistaceae bacterium]|nr:FAD-binding protein [Synergistaceae bacterium]